MPDLPDFIPKLNHGVLVDRHINRVKDLNDVQANGWKETLIRQLFGRQSAAAILNIPLPSSYPQSDVVKWVLDPKGLFSAKKAYQFVNKGRLSVAGTTHYIDWKRIWKLKMQHRLRLLLWKVAAHALPLRSRMGLFGDSPEAYSLYCPFCKLHSETAESTCFWSAT